MQFVSYIFFLSLNHCLKFKENLIQCLAGYWKAPIKYTKLKLYANPLLSASGGALAGPLAVFLPRAQMRRMPSSTCSPVLLTPLRPLVLGESVQVDAPLIVIRLPGSSGWGAAALTVHWAAQGTVLRSFFFTLYILDLRQAFLGSITEPCSSSLPCYCEGNWCCWKIQIPKSTHRQETGPVQENRGCL